MEIVKFIVQALHKPPFSKNFNVISFDSLAPEELFQILSDVLQEINDQAKIDIHVEDFEQTATRIFNMLHILRYKPFSDQSSNVFRQNILRCEKNTIYVLLEWLLSNTETLKQRVYLARFLMKIDVPSEILGDSDIATLNQQYVQLLEEFKKVHKESVLAKNVNKISISELRSDGVTMEKEKEIVSNRIYHIRKKVDNLPNIGHILQSCHNLRVEQDRKKEIAWQLQEESLTINQSEQRLFRLSQQFQEIQKRSVGLSSQALLKKLEEEIYVTSYIVEQKLPRELSQLKKEKEILENIAYSNNVTQASNDALNAKIQSFTQQINKLVETRLMVSNNTDDKTVLFRQQAAIIARKKDSLAEKFSQLKLELQEIHSKLQQRQQRLEEVVGKSGTVFKDNEKFQEYVNKLRTRSTIYKRYRNDVAALKAECGVLTRTIDILQAKASKLGIELSNLNLAPGTEFDEGIQSKSSDALLGLITQITANVAAQKAKIGPMISQVKPLHEKIRQLSTTYDEKKKLYDRTKIALNVNLTKLVNEVSELQENHLRTILEISLSSSNIHIAQVSLKRAKDEFQANVAKNNTTPLIRDRLNNKIAESEKLGRLLKEEQKDVRENEKKSVKQKNSWDDIYQLLKLKIRYLEQEKEEMHTLMHLERGAETLVLR